jgi:hypothetical protein
LPLQEAIPEFDGTKTFDDFKSAIFKLHPGSESERKWTIADMDTLVGEQLRVGILDVSDLGNYYRVFYTITQFLLTKNCISEAEQSRAFIRGFQPDLWRRISRRLEIKLPDHDSDDFYSLFEINEAAKHVLHGTSQITFYRVVSHRPHPLLSRRHHTSKRKIYQRYSSKWHRVSSRCSRRKSRRQTTPAPALTPKRLCWIR